MKNPDIPQPKKGKRKKIGAQTREEEKGFQMGKRIEGKVLKQFDQKKKGALRNPLYHNQSRKL